MKPMPAAEPRLDPHVLEQAMLWMVRLQSGVSCDAEQLACQRWRQESAAHELAWQRLSGIGQGLREGTCGLSAAGARSLLEARSLPSRRAVLKSLVAGGVLIASGYGVQQRSVLRACSAITPLPPASAATGPWPRGWRCNWIPVAPWTVMCSMASGC